MENIKSVKKEKTIRVFTDEEVERYRKEIKEGKTSVRKITDLHKVSKASVIFMLMGRTYKHVPDPLTTVATHRSGGGKSMTEIDKFLAFHALAILKLSYKRAGKLLGVAFTTVPRRANKYDPRNYAKHRANFVKNCIKKGKIKSLRALNMHRDKVNF